MFIRASSFLAAAFVIVACTLSIGGCSGNSKTTDATVVSTDGGVRDGAVADAHANIDAAGHIDAGSGIDGGICPTDPCPGSDKCCADVANGTASCASSCASDDILACTTPSDCGGETPECCGTLVVNGGSVPDCTVASFTTSCAAGCVSNIAFSCTGTDTLHMCGAASDCAADTANPNCCGISGHNVCVSTVIKTLGSLTCF